MAVRRGGSPHPEGLRPDFAADDLLSQVVMERMLAGLTTRRCARLAEAVGDQVEGCVGDAASMLNAERSFRRVRGYKQMPVPVAALHRHGHPSPADSTETVGASPKVHCGSSPKFNAVLGTVKVDMSLVPGETTPIGPSARVTSADISPRRRSWSIRYRRALFCFDSIIVLSAITLAGFVRFGFREADMRGLPYNVVAALLALAWLATLGLLRCYDAKLLGTGPEEFKRVLASSLRFAGLVAILSYTLRLELARGFVATAFPLGTAGLLVERYTARRWLQARRRRRAGEYVNRVLAVGSPTHVVDFVKRVRHDPCAGFNVVGVCLQGEHEAEWPYCEDYPRLVGTTLPVVGTLATIPHAVEVTGVDTVAVTASPGISSEALRRLAWQLEGSGVDLVVAPALTDVAGPRITMRPVAGLPLMYVEQPGFSGGKRIAKEICDKLLALGSLLVTLPVMGAIALAIKFDDGGPVLFGQTRMGKDSQEFRLYKFRSMVADAEARLSELNAANDCDGVLFKMRADPRVTRVGRLLRASSLDELPQLFNVLQGHMSLVGPRPPLPEEVARYEFPEYRRLLVKPGITGLWQVSGRSDLPWAETMRLDLYYVENWSLSLDLMLLWKTIFAVWRRSGAY